MESPFPVLAILNWLVMNEVQNSNYKGFIFASGPCIKLHDLLINEAKRQDEIPNAPVVELTLNMLLSVGIRTFILAASPDQLVEYQKALGDGKQFGSKISYSLIDEGVNAIQALAEVNEFVARSKLVAVNAGVVIAGEKFEKLFKGALATNKGATSFQFISTDAGMDTVMPELIVLDHRSNQYAESAVAECGISATLRELQQSIANQGQLHVVECDGDSLCLDFGKQTEKKFNQIKHLLKLAN